VSLEVVIVVATIVVATMNSTIIIAAAETAPEAKNVFRLHAGLWLLGRSGQSGRHSNRPFL